MSITHIVMFQFNESASSGDISAVCQRMLDLKAQCLHPTTRKPYIQGGSGGKDNSPEGAQAGTTHAFVVEFASASDRDYYLNEDPVHKRFVESLSGLIMKSQVVDFTPGVF
ncbi:hypothetical protein B0T10DRAFT_564498 [Thelonectria olida]|uniref:Stress-response A/B barrel domain-containing protein n=1 Tax=Thelonectria olida TaxID=1576542 RepID=A0A9P8VXN5_9HYPO|nr:hypothetical protein B0T10DRAFT_564498 [Thelonectria olida]